MIDKIIEGLYYSLFFLTPLIVFPKTSELFEFNKMLFIYLITTLIIFSWVLKMILHKKIIFKKTIFDIPILLFFVFQLISSIFSIDRQTSLFGYYGRFNGGLVSIISYLVLYYAFISNPVIKIEKLLKSSLLSSLIVILWGLPGKFGYDLSCFIFMGQLNNNCWTTQFRPAERMFSTLGQPNWLGTYLAINFFIGLYFLLKEIIQQGNKVTKKQSNNNKLLIIYSTYIFLNFSSILFTRSRSALMAVVFGLITFSLFLLMTKSWRQLDYKKIAIIFFFTLVVPFLSFKTGIEKIDKLINPSTYINFVFKQKTTQQSSNITMKQYSSDITESLDIRKIVWQGAVNLGLRYPLFGTGVETFAYSYYFVRPQEHNLTSEWDYLYNKAHNEYLNYFATTGFVGLLAYFLMISVVCLFLVNKIFNFQFSILNQFKNLEIKNSLKISNFKFKITNKAFETDSLLVVSLLLVYISILITNFFGFSTTTINLFFYLIPAFLVNMHYSDNKLDINENEIKNLKLDKRQKSFLFILLSSTLYLLFSIFVYWLADVKYALAENYFRISDYQTASKLYDQALKLRFEHVYQDRLSYSLANLAFIASYQKESDLTKNLILLADNYNNQSLKTSPQNVIYWKTRAKNYYLFYQITLDKKNLEKGIEALDKAKKLSPTDPKITYSLAIFYSLLADEARNKDEKKHFENQSLRFIDESIHQKANFRDGYFLKAQLLRKFGNKNEAKRTFQYILEKIDQNDEEVRKEIRN